jgi:hypothetical protein
MTILGDANAIIFAHKKVLEDLPTVLEGLKDTDYPLEHRWDAFVELCKNNVLVNNDTYGDGFIDQLSKTLCIRDDFLMDRHETMTFVSMYERIMEADGEWESALIEARETNLAKWQEAVLASGYSSFTYDW